MKKKTKKTLVVISCVLLVVILAVTMMFFRISQSMKVYSIGNINLNELSDGTYIGKADNEMIKAEIAVTVYDNEISNIDIIRHDNGLGSKAEIIVDDVIAHQSLDVDIISSATYSSNIILKAIENALIQGKEQ